MGGLAGLAGLYSRYWPEDGLYNACTAESLPESLSENFLIQKAIDGLDFTQVWDNHVHVVGIGDQSKDLWVNPDLMSWGHPLKHIQLRFYLDASCTGDQSAVDQGYVDRMNNVMRDLPAGMKAMLLAFDYYHNEQGVKDLEKSFFYTSNKYAAEIYESNRERFEWVASIHPYRENSIELLKEAKDRGARAIKWLPEAMGIDPASSKCTPFYQAMQKYNVPLLSHAGHETAVGTSGHPDSGNPLLLRHALDQGVKVIVAHCASLGSAKDLDKGSKGSEKSCFDLFVRMMNEANYNDLLCGDISALLQMNRLDEPVKQLLLKEEWHSRLINGSDYPLPGILPIIPLKMIKRMGLLSSEQSLVLREVRKYNPMWFDFLLKRMIRWQGKGFSNSVFETRGHFQ